MEKDMIKLTYGCVGVTWEDIAADLSQAFEKIFDAILNEVDPKTWDELRIEFQLRNGLILLYPHKHGDKRKKHRFLAEIESTFLLDEYKKLPGPNSGVKHLKTYELALNGQVKLALRTALNKPEAMKRLKEMVKQSRCTIWIQEGKDGKSAYQLYL